MNRHWIILIISVVLMSAAGTAWATPCGTQDLTGYWVSSSAFTTAETDPTQPLGTLHVEQMSCREMVVRFSGRNQLITLDGSTTGLSAALVTFINRKGLDFFDTVRFAVDPWTGGNTIRFEFQARLRTPSGVPNPSLLANIAHGTGSLTLEDSPALRQCFDGATELGVLLSAEIRGPMRVTLRLRIDRVTGPRSIPAAIFRYMQSPAPPIDSYNVNARRWTRRLSTLVGYEYTDSFTRLEQVEISMAGVASTMMLPLCESMRLRNELTTRGDALGMDRVPIDLGTGALPAAGGAE